ncbi:MAG: LmeA family phospholipid-binding protein [Solirubrobacterales bacterium]
MRRGGGGGKAVRVALWLLGVVVVLLGLAQLFLPKIAAGRISSRIGKYGSVDSVHVSAWPAVELLWRHADSVTVHATRLRVSPAQTGKLLEEASGADRVEAHVDSVREGPLALSDVSFHKRGSRMSAQAHVSTADVAAALPPGFGVQLLGSGAGKVEVRASGGLFGVDASVDAVAEASGGKLVVHPRGLLLEGFRLTLFSDPDVYVMGVSAAPAGRGGGATGSAAGAGGSAGGATGYLLGMEATLR